MMTYLQITYLFQILLVLFVVIWDLDKGSNYSLKDLLMCLGLILTAPIMVWCVAFCIICYIKDQIEYRK